MQNREDLSGGVAFMRPRQAESKIVQLLGLNPSLSYHLRVKMMIIIINKTIWWPYYKWVSPSPLYHLHVKTMLMIITICKILDN